MNSGASSASKTGRKTSVASSDKHSSVSVDTSSLPGFPGAVVLAGGASSLKKAVDNAAEQVARELKSAASKGAADAAAHRAAGSPGAKTSKSELATGQHAVAQNAQKAEKDSKKINELLKTLQAEQTQVASAASGPNGAPSHAPSSSVATGPGLSNIQQQPPQQTSAGHTGAENQNPTVTVIDLRHPSQNNNSSSGQGGNQGQTNDGSNIRMFQLADGGASSSARLNNQAGMMRAGGAPASGQSFSALTDQIVKQTGILLKNNNSGEIRLVLKPEKLGSLRIKIDMNNNNLTGRILVQNHEALKLIQHNLDSLYRALRESGFTATALNVSVGGREGGEHKDRERSSPLPSMRAISGIKGFDNQAPALETSGANYSLVNLVI